MSIKPLFIYIFSGFFIAVLFIIFPQLDIGFSQIFFADSEFFLSGNFFVYWVNKSVYYLVMLITMLLVVLFLYGLIRNNASLRKKSIYLLVVLILGPGLIVNLVFKNNFGRVRPKNIIEFGGDSYFSPAFYISDQCKSNCSFTCGDASVGFYIYAFCYVFPQNRKWFFLLASIITLLFSFVRIVLGAHFLSDVIFSGYITIFTIHIMYGIFGFNQLKEK